MNYEHLMAFSKEKPSTQINAQSTMRFQNKALFVYFLSAGLRCFVCLDGKQFQHHNTEGLMLNIRVALTAQRFDNKIKLTEHLKDTTVH